MRKTILFILFSLLLFPAQSGAGNFRLLCGNLVPLNYINEDGKAEGFAVELFEAIMSRAGHIVSGKDCIFEPWARAVEDLKATPDTVLMSMAMTDQRKPLFKWVGPIYTMKLGLIARKDSNIRINAPDDLRKYRIGVIRQSGPEQILTHDYNVRKANLVQLTRDSQQFAMLDVGRVDLVTHTDLSSPLILDSMGLNPDDYEMVFVLKTIDLYYAFNPETDEHLIVRLQKELDQMKQKRLDGSSEYTDMVIKHLKNGPLHLK